MFDRNPIEFAFEEMFESISSHEEVLIIFIIAMAIFVAIMAIIGIALYIFNGVVITALSKKIGYKYGYLAWIPFIHGFTTLWVLMDMAGDKPFSLFGGKITLKNRRTPFFILLGVSLVMPIFGFIIGLISAIPLIGKIIYIFGMLFIYAVAYSTQCISYVYLRDVGELFKEDKVKNRTTSIVVSIIDALFTGIISRTIYLATMLKDHPVTPKE